MKLVECVPNFSNGRDRRVIDAVVEAAAGVDGVRVLDVDPGADTNRTVLTFVGAPDDVVEAAFRVIATAGELVDMRTQTGAHARHGATDVCPFVPVTGVTMADCAELARRLGARVGEELGIPVYLYEHAASRPEWRNLAVVRKGEYEALPDKLGRPEWKPDFGPNEWSAAVARTGVVTIGAREFLIAYNINLNTRDKRWAKDIANEIREKGRVVRRGQTDAAYWRGKKVRYDVEGGKLPCPRCDHVAETVDALDTHLGQVHGDGLDDLLARVGQSRAALHKKFVKRPGLFAHCKAMGWVIEEYGCAQITMNLTDFHVTSPHVVLEKVREMAAERGLVVTGSEIVGVVPYEAMLEAADYYADRFGGSKALPWRDRVDSAVRSMGLADVAPFDVDDKVLGLPDTPDECLMALSARGFVDEVSRESPAPGGGSVAALAGSLAAALGAMVANLAMGKTGYEPKVPKLNELAGRLQTVKDRLVRSVDTDTDAFNEVLTAMRLPSKTADDKARRAAAIQEGYKSASRVPLQTAELCLEAVELAAEIGRLGMPASASDAGVAALMGCAGVEGAVYNVRINLPSIDDEGFCAELGAELDGLVARARQIRDALDTFVRESIAAS